MRRVTIMQTAAEAVADTPDGAVVLVGGFGSAGQQTAGAAH
jgi:acyl CoA:acetate/3-ketoacid CoA transferase alpha subunit